MARSDSNEPFTRGPLQARVGEPVELSVALVDPAGDVLADVESLRLSRRRARAPQGPLPEGAVVRWLRVVPRQEHVELPPPNPGIATFSNNVLFGPEHGDWLGYDTLEYDTVFVDGATGTHHVVERAAPSWGRRDTEGAGSNWYAVEVTLPDGTVVRSPDGDDVDGHGLSSDVLRVSFRAGDDFIGWLGTYINVPHLFGSAGPSDRRHQAERYVGADCADALVGARRASGYDDISYGSVGGIGRVADAVTDDLYIGVDGILRDAEGTAVTLRWGEDVERGDLVALDFVRAGNWLPRSWDHIGALLNDGGEYAAANGVLDWTDAIRHMSRRGVVDNELWEFGSIRLRIWRWED